MLDSRSSTVDLTTTGLETYGGTLTTIESPGFFVPPPNTIVSDGEYLTVGDIDSSYTYEETGGSNESESASGTTTTTTSIFATNLESTTEVDLTATDLTHSEWTIINLGEEDEDEVGFE